MEWLGLGAVLLLLFGSRGGSTASESPQDETKSKQKEPIGAKDVLDRLGDTAKKLAGAAPLAAGLLGGLGGGGGAGAGAGAGGGAGAGAGGGAGGGGTGAGATGGTVAAEVASGTSNAVQLAAAAAVEVTTGAVIAAALPVGYIIGFIVAGEVVKAQERFKDLQSLLVSKSPSAAALNNFEVKLLSLELQRWGLKFNTLLFRDPRCDFYVRGSNIKVKNDRTQLVSEAGSGAPGTDTTEGYAMWSAFGPKAVLRVRQAAFEYLSWRGFYAAKLMRSWPAAAQVPAQQFDLPPGPSYDYLEPGLGGLEQVPDPVSGPRQWPNDPQGAAPSLGELIASFGRSPPGNDCPQNVLCLARLWALIEVLAVAQRIAPTEEPWKIAQRVAGVDATTIEPARFGWRLPTSFWGPFEGCLILAGSLSVLSPSYSITGMTITGGVLQEDFAGVAVVPEFKRPEPKVEVTGIVKPSGLAARARIGVG